MNTHLNRRRLQDVRLWNKIRNSGYEHVAIRLCRGYAFLCWGADMRVSSWTERVSSSYNPISGLGDDEKLLYLTRCKQDYLNWIEECIKCGVWYRAVMDILFFGKSYKDVEKIYRHRHGWAISNMMQAFELYRK